MLFRTSPEAHRDGHRVFPGGRAAAASYQPISSGFANELELHLRLPCVPA